MAKDKFSANASFYARYRPSYPAELIEYVVSFVKERNRAWDCATGNGQVAVLLADFFKEVLATDISQNQLSNAKKNERVIYSIARAEETNFPEDYFDLITVGQAYHWFNFLNFEKEVKRVAREEAVIAVWGYTLMVIGDPGIDNLLRKFYEEIVGPYWDPERKILEDHFRNVPFNFEPLPTKDFRIELNWTRNELLGFLRSWSAVQNFLKARGTDPVEIIAGQLEPVWSDKEEKNIHFPMILKLGRVNK